MRRDPTFVEIVCAVIAITICTIATVEVILMIGRWILS